MKILRSSLALGFIALAALGCGSPKPAAGPESAASAGTFRWAPAPGTRFERTAELVEDIELVGTEQKLRRDRTVTLEGAFTAEGDTTVLTQHYTKAAVALSGVAEARVERPLDLTLEGVFTADGELTEIRGVAAARTALLDALRLSDEPDAAVSEDTIVAVLASRYLNLVADLVGQPTAPGSTWTVELEGDPLLTRRTLTVQRTEPCGDAVCHVVTADYGVDSDAVAILARVLFEGVAQGEPGEAAPAVEVGASEYSARDTLVLEADTLRYHRAEFVEDARAKLIVDGAEREVRMSRAETFDYTYR